MAQSSQLNAYDAFRFIDIQKRQLIAGYDILRRENESSAGRHVVLVGMLMALGSMKEATRILCDMNPNFKDIMQRFETDLQRWNRVRDDTAHVFDRVFSSPRKGANIPWTANGLRVASYDSAADTVNTGDSIDGSFILWTAIEKVFKLSSLLELTHHGVKESDSDIYQGPISEQIKEYRDEIAREMALVLCRSS